MIESLIIIFVLYILLFLISIYIKDNSIVDIFWGLWFWIISIILFLNSNQYIFQIITLALILTWWLRLSLYIFYRKLKKSWEDKRYKKRRNEWKYFYTRSFFQVYILQMIIMFLIATPLFIILLWENNLWINIYLIIWTIISVFWILYESIADYQLFKFLKNKNKWEILTTWLRKFHRYPNYFWEICFWLWIWIIWIQISLFSLVWFVIITFLLVFVSGIAMTDNRYKWNSNYEKYKSNTAALIPKIF